MSIKSDKTFEEIVERLAILFKLKLRARDSVRKEESIEADAAPKRPAARKPALLRKKKT